MKRSSPGRRPAGTEGQAGHEAEPKPEAVDAAARVAREHEIIEKFLAASAPLFDVVIARLEEARREGAEFFYRPGIEQEIQDRKESNAAIRKLVGYLEALKELQNKRLEDLRWLVDEFSPGRSKPHDL